MSSTHYIDRKTVNASYRPKSNLMSPGLKRAREPYRVKNALTGLALGAFAVGIWAYSISAVKQDVFDDVDEEARSLAQSGQMAAITSLEDDKKATEAAATEPISPNATLQSHPPSPAVNLSSISLHLDKNVHSGILVKLLGDKFPGLFDPTRKTLVWGAPPVESLGVMRLRNSTE